MHQPPRIVGALCAGLLAHGMSAADIQLPDPLTFLDGTRVGSGAAWMDRRRAELLEIFRREEYGRNAVERPADLTFTVTSTKTGVMGGAADVKQVHVAWKGPHGSGGMDLTLFAPAKRTKPAPCMLLICNRSRSNIDPNKTSWNEFFPADTIISRGYAAAVFYNGDVDPDTDDGFKNGVHGVFDTPTTPRPGDAWATIAAWAWGAHRAVDYLTTDGWVDAGRIAVVGQSRGGKTALWAGAQDQRIAMTVSNCSGCGGAAASRGKGGQAIVGITAEFPHWFAGNFKNWSNKEWTMPFDQHEVLALCAPRLVYVASASEDWGADPQAEFRSCVQASPVWGLWNRTGVSSTTFPAVNTPLHGGSIGYHVRQGAHDLTRYDWNRFMDFADRNLTAATATNVVSIAATDASASESGGTGAFTISRTGSTLTALTVTIAVGGTATAGIDYAALPRTVTIPAGAGSATLTVTPRLDAVTDADETVIVTLPVHPAYALGGATSATVTITDVAPFKASINFQPAPSPTVSGWLVDAGAVFADRGGGRSYGWDVDIAASARDRNSSAAADQLHDTLLHMQKPTTPTAKWEIAVPNGQYDVELVAGDPSFTDSVYRMAVEGMVLIDATPDAAHRWITRSATVTVKDGRLTLTSATGAANNKVCCIDIRQRPSSTN